jgi:hypothetical protein
MRSSARYLYRRIRSSFKISSIYFHKMMMRRRNVLLKWSTKSFVTPRTTPKMNRLQYITDYMH